MEQPNKELDVTAPRRRHVRLVLGAAGQFQHYQPPQRYSVKTHRHNALLLLGSTGSGKTPLGWFLEQHGLAGLTRFHFEIQGTAYLSCSNTRFL